MLAVYTLNLDAYHRFGPIYYQVMEPTVYLAVYSTTAWVDGSG
jgi:hypothetical protein